MGHGASTNVKSVTINDQYGHDHQSGWTRSNSDGCIVETSLSSSKTKIDLLYQQRTELKELLNTTKERLQESENKHSEIQKQMAEVEGTNFELRDTVSELEQIVESLQAQLAQNQQQDLTGTLEAKDSYIEQLQTEASNYHTQIDKLKVKYRKRLNALKTQLAEVKQEGSLKLYKLKKEFALLEEENDKLSAKLDRASSAYKSKQHKDDNLNNGDDEANITDWEDSRTKVILELSTQLSVQQEKIEELQTILDEKEQQIVTLQRKPDRSDIISLVNCNLETNGKKKSAMHQTGFPQRWQSSSMTDGKKSSEESVHPIDSNQTQRWQLPSNTDFVADGDIGTVKKTSKESVHIGSNISQRWQSLSNTDFVADGHIEPQNNCETIGRVTSATSVTSSGLSDISVPDETAGRRRRRRKQKESSRQMSAESYDSGVCSVSRNKQTVSSSVYCVQKQNTTIVK